MRWFSALIDRAAEGRFAPIFYRWLAGVFVFGAVSEIAANGLTDLAWVEGFLAVGALVAAYTDD